MRIPIPFRFDVMAIAFVVASFLALALAPHAEAAPRVKKVLFFTKSSGWEHSVIKQRAGEPSFAEQILAEEGAKRGIAFTFSKDGSVFSKKYLAQFDAIFFYTSGDLLSPGKDGNPPMTSEGKAALLEAIRKGKGFIGTHSAADTFHTGEVVDTVAEAARIVRHRHLGDRADPYTRMLGAEFIMHGSQQVAKARVVDPKFPGIAQFGAHLECLEEWYSITDFSRDMHVLLLMETEGMKDVCYQRPPYPIAWARMHGKGRVFYTSLGHREDVWTNPAFQEHLFGGIAWAVRNVDADITPNLNKVAPRAFELPPKPPLVAPPLRKNPTRAPRRNKQVGAVILNRPVSCAWLPQGTYSTAGLARSSRRSSVRRSSWVRKSSCSITDRTTAGFPR